MRCNAGNHMLWWLSSNLFLVPKIFGAFLAWAIWLILRTGQMSFSSSLLQMNCNPLISRAWDSVTKPLLPALRCYFGLTPTGNSTSSIGFGHAEECERENLLGMEILFPRTRQKGLTAGPLLTKVRSGSSQHWILGCLKKEEIFKGSGKAARVTGQSLTQRKLPLSSMGVSLEKGQWGLAHKPCIWI